MDFEGKILLTSTILLFTFSSITLAMEENDFEQKDRTFPVQQKGNKDTEKIDCYSHWGLSHWVAGIGEYIHRTAFCGYGFDYAYPNRQYITVRDDQSIKGSSDCYCVQQNECAYCDNPIQAILCCPVVTLGHLCCLPFAVCDFSERQEISEYTE